MDLVITNALILDCGASSRPTWASRTAGSSRIGKAGNPDVQPGCRHRDRAGTEVIAGEGQILTAGAVRLPHPLHLPAADRGGPDVRRHHHAGGGTGPAAGTAATTCTPGPWNIARMPRPAEAWPMNIGCLARAMRRLPGPAARAGRAPGAMGLKLHEDWGTTPAAIDCCLPVARHRGRPGAASTPIPSTSPASWSAPWPPSAAARSTPITPRVPAAAMRRTSSAPAARPTSLPLLTNPTRPYTVNTVDEHLDMRMVCHHLRQEHPRGRRLRRVAHPARDHRRRGHPARPGRVLDDRLGLPGHGPRGRGYRHLADRAQDEGAARRPVRGQRAQRQSARRATSRNTPSTPR